MHIADSGSWHSHRFRVFYLSPQRNISKNNGHAAGTVSYHFLKIRLGSF